MLLVATTYAVQVMAVCLHQEAALDSLLGLTRLGLPHKHNHLGNHYSQHNQLNS